MASMELRKRLFFFLIFGAVLIVVLASLPFIESSLQDYLLPGLGVEIAANGVVISREGANPERMIFTYVYLVINLFRVIKIIIWMALIISAVRLVTYLIFGTAFRNAAQAEALSLIKTVLSVIVYIVAFFVVFQSQYPQAELGSLFTGSAILGIVVGLALQDTLGNLFAGIALQADQPFQVGDVIAMTSTQGTGVVESISWRGVKIRTFQNKVLVISNSVLGKETIEVAPKDNVNARLVFFNTLYTDSPSKTQQVLRDSIRQVENVSQKHRPIIRIRNLGDNGIDWEVKYWLEDYTRYNDTDALIRQWIWYIFQRENINFAYPTHTIHIEEKRPERDFVEMINTVSERLSRVPIFAPLSDEELDRLAKATTSRIYSQGEPIVRKGQEGNSMYIIVRGGVNVQINDGGVIKTVNTLGENDFFGEMSLLTGQPRSATVVAEKETEVLQIRKSAMKAIFQTNPDLVKSIVEIIEERKELLKTGPSEQVEMGDDKRRGVVRSIKGFFGLK
jgi:small-conductance mechanosensitive channel